jgi:hypothetical protein
MMVRNMSDKCSNIDMEEVFIVSVMVMSISVIGKMINFMVTEFIYLLIMISIKVNSLKVKNKGEVFINIDQELYMMENG